MKRSVGCDGLDLGNFGCVSEKARAVCLHGLLFDPEDGGNTFVRNVGKLLPDYITSHPRRQYCC
jgi:hypothetical protein